MILACNSQSNCLLFEEVPDLNLQPAKVFVEFFVPLFEMRVNN